MYTTSSRAHMSATVTGGCPAPLLGAALVAPALPRDHVVVTRAVLRYVCTPLRTSRALALCGNAATHARVRTRACACQVFVVCYSVRLHLCANPFLGTI